MKGYRGEDEKEKLNSNGGFDLRVGSYWLSS